MFRTAEQLSLTLYSKSIISKILTEFKEIGRIFLTSESEEELHKDLGILAVNILKENPVAYKYYTGSLKGRNAFDQLRWKDFAAIRLLEYIKHAGEGFQDMNLNGNLVINNPLRTLWTAIRTDSGPGTIDFYHDMMELFRQLAGSTRRMKPTFDRLEDWMDRYHSGLDEDIMNRNQRSKDRIIKKLISKLDSGKVPTHRFRFGENITEQEKYQLVEKWWHEKDFHLKMAIRSVSELNDFLDGNLDEDTLQTLRQAEAKGIPLFVNPYYLSLLNCEDQSRSHSSDRTLRDYIFANKDLVEEFGKIRAWEKEDEVMPNQPNAAGWIIPEGGDLHRRYPEVAIFIPQTTGRSCGGLCVSCQRMYDFQSGRYNFNLEKLKPRTNWTTQLKAKMEYFRKDAQLRDILITGGDALMSSDRTLEVILDHVFNMACQKIEDNKQRKEGEKYAEMQRVRLGTRLPVYLPQRITPELIRILTDFRRKASRIGIKQFVIQTHFVSALEVTPESRKAIEQLLSAGWMITNQEVFTAAASRRGHSAKLRKVLNDMGILTYYTFQVKGHFENRENFAPIARAVQEQVEEKVLGSITNVLWPEVKKLSSHPKGLKQKISSIRRRHGLPFLATDRNIMNIPGVGKSLTFKVIGLTNDGRRILEFEHDQDRNHSPIIHRMDKVTIIESKTISQYLRQIENMGESPAEYHSLFGYSMGETEKRMPIYEYPDYEYGATDELTNLEI